MDPESGFPTIKFVEWIPLTVIRIQKNSFLNLQWTVKIGSILIARSKQWIQCWFQIFQKSWKPNCHDKPNSWNQCKRNEKLLFFSLVILIFVVLIAYSINNWRKDRIKRQTEGKRWYYHRDSDVGYLKLVTVFGCWWQTLMNRHQHFSSSTSVTNVDITVSLLKEL